MPQNIITWALKVLALLTLVMSFAQGQQQKTAGSDQSTETKYQNQAKEPDPNFTCPDPRSAEACKSFAELYRAGDEDVKPSFENSVEFACFRPGVDEFFILEYRNPRFNKTHLDPKSHEMVPDVDATSSGGGGISGYAKGQHTEISPILFFFG